MADANTLKKFNTTQVGLLQPVMVTQAPAFYQQNRNGAETVHPPNQRQLTTWNELLGQTFLFAGILPGKKEGALPDLFYLETEPRASRWVLHELAME